MDDFIVRAAVAAVGIALAAGPLGCFVLWRRMAYFGDSVAHAGLLGVLLGLLLQWPVTLGLIVSSLAVAFLLAWLQVDKRLSTDTLLGVIAHGGLALGLVIVAMTPYASIDIPAFLFGDILSITQADVFVIYAASAGILLLIALCFKPLVALMLSEDIAAVEGFHVARMRLLLLAMVALMIGIAIKVTGLLLITSLLLLPAAAARYFSRTPVQMIVLSSALAAASTLAGLKASLTWDTPSGPSIVLAALVIFAISRCVSRSPAA